MLSVSSLLDFLMSLLRDEDAKAEFERDPEGVLARNGFEDVCGQDVRDAGSMLANDRSVSLRSHDNDGGGHYGSGHYGSGHYGSGHYGSGHYGSGQEHAVKEIEYITKNYVVKEAPVYNNSFNDYIVDYTYVDDRDVIGDGNNVNNGTINASDGSAVSLGGDASGNQDNSTDVDVDIEDSFNSDDDETTVSGSFNSDDDGVDVDGDDNTVAGGDVDQTAIVNSGNEDNDGIDNDGDIKGSTAAGGGITDSGNTDVAIDDSGNEDNDDVTVNDDDTEFDADIDDSFNTVDQSQTGLVNAGNVNDTADVDLQLL